MLKRSNDIQGHSPVRAWRFTNPPEQIRPAVCAPTFTRPLTPGQRGSWTCSAWVKPSILSTPANSCLAVNSLTRAKAQRLTVDAADIRKKRIFPGFKPAVCDLWFYLGSRCLTATFSEAGGLEGSGKGSYNSVSTSHLRRLITPP